MTLPDHHSGERFQSVRCSECGYGYLDPAPPPGELEPYYSTNESGASMRRPQGAIFRQLQRIAFDRETRILRSKIEPGAPILDLGAGDGAMVRYLRSKGYRAAAADFYAPSEWPHAGIPYRQLDLHGGALAPEALATANTGIPRAAVMRHVLEHLHEPGQVIGAIAAAQVEWLYIVVPNCASVLARRFGAYWYYWDPPRHLQFFERDTLRKMCQRGGFRMEAEGWYGIDEIVTSAYRRALLSPSLPARGIVVSLTRPKGILAGAVSALSAPWGKAVCWILARRQT
jgi:hypothetical protein